MKALIMQLVGNYPNTFDNLFNEKTKLAEINSIKGGERVN